jgi:hypothetical protein
LMSSFNIFFTNFPVLALGILDQDVRPSSSLKYPALYKETQANTQFTSQRRLLWFANGIYVGVVSYMCVFYGIHGGESDTSSGRTFGLWEVGTTLYTSIVVTLNVQMALYSNFWTIYHHITIWGSIVLWFILNTVLSETDPYYSTFSYKTFVPIVSKSAKFWLGIWPVAVAGLLPYIMVITIRRNYYPTLADKVQDFDADERNNRIKSDRESITANTDVEVTVKSPRRLGTLKGVVVESLGVEPVAAPPVPKHRRKLSFADVWGPEKQFPDIAASTSSGHAVRPPSAANSARNSLEDKNYTEVMSAIDERL